VERQGIQRDTPTARGHAMPRIERIPMPLQLINLLSVPDMDPDSPRVCRELLSRELRSSLPSKTHRSHLMSICQV
jgi:hypothetical protein